MWRKFPRWNFRDTGSRGLYVFTCLQGRSAQVRTSQVYNCQVRNGQVRTGRLQTGFFIQYFVRPKMFCYSNFVFPTFVITQKRISDFNPNWIMMQHRPKWSLTLLLAQLFSIYFISTKVESHNMIFHSNNSNHITGIFPY